MRRASFPEGVSERDGARRICRSWAPAGLLALAALLLSSAPAASAPAGEMAGTVSRAEIAERLPDARVADACRFVHCFDTHEARTHDSESSAEEDGTQPDPELDRVPYLDASASRSVRFAFGGGAAGSRGFRVGPGLPRGPPSAIA